MANLHLTAPAPASPASTAVAILTSPSSNFTTDHSSRRVTCPPALNTNDIPDGDISCDVDGRSYDTSNLITPNNAVMVPLLSIAQDASNCTATTITTFTTKGGIVISPYSTFYTFLPIWSTAQEIFSKHKMKRSTLFRTSSQRFTEETSLQRFGVKNFIPPKIDDHQGLPIPMPFRGSLQCNFPGCQFKLPFKFGLKTNLYSIGGGLCLNHNHPPTGTDLEGCTQVKNKVDLGDAEIEKLNTLAVSCMGMSQIRESMSLHFPLRDFSTKLLERMINSELDRKFGSNREQMTELMAKGRKTEKKGGIWEPVWGPSLHLVGCHYQTATNRLYAIQYGTYYFTADGTHDTNKYGLITSKSRIAECCRPLVNVKDHLRILVWRHRRFIKERCPVRVS